jgi:hypothetical protein
MLSFLEDCLKPDSIADQDTLLRPQYPRSEWTFGVEHEWGDVRFGVPLPGGNKWNDKDFTCVASCGIANDPSGELYPFSGEINTAPTSDPEGQAEHLRNLLAAIALTDSPVPKVNYRSNMHIHIRVPGLKEDLGALKRVLRYFVRWGEASFKLVEPIPKPDAHLFPDPEHLAWAMKRYRRRQVSHQETLPPARVEEMLVATDPWHFFRAHHPLPSNPESTNRDRMSHLFRRPGVNIRQLWEDSETVEFRHWPGTLTPDQVRDATEWCARWMDAALNHPDDETPQQIWDSVSAWNLPTFPDYEYACERVYDWTNSAWRRKKVLPRYGVLKERMPELWLNPEARPAQDVWDMVQSIVAESPELGPL